MEIVLIIGTNYQDDNPSFSCSVGLNLVWASDISLVPFHTTVTKFVNTKYFVTCMAPHSDLIVWTKDGTKKIDKNSGK